jgi:crotonobetainyl-CoA:carnitine CoA-transferase CaiB-like acyl-CoA transferase
MQSEVGLVSITGTPDTPSKVGLSIADIAGQLGFNVPTIERWKQEGVI